ncbi:hypothetical protein [Streptosporangium roseum]|uniref:hypothetical protein n=1 Tax=Streptosporangium roseum TaxID=2001 RepID=UPI0033313F6B
MTAFVNEKPVVAGESDGSTMELFQLMSWRWSVTSAKELADGRAPTAALAVADWVGMLRLLMVDEEHAKRVDLAEPLIAVSMPTGGLLIIDGWHRVYKALASGRSTLPAHVLTVEEERACRIRGGE